MGLDKCIADAHELNNKFKSKYYSKAIKHLKNAELCFRKADTEKKLAEIKQAEKDVLAKRYEAKSQLKAKKREAKKVEIQTTRTLRNTSAHKDRAAPIIDHTPAPVSEKEIDKEVAKK